MRATTLYRSGFLLLVAGFAHADPWWQPEGLQKNIVERLVKHIEKTTPYRIEIQKIGGNFFKVFSLQGVKIRVEGKSDELVTVRSIDVDLNWRALMDKKIEIQRLAFLDPVVHLRIKKDGTLDLPKMAESKEKEEEPSWSIARIQMINGRLVVTSLAGRPAQEVTIQPIQFIGKLTPQRLSVEKFVAKLGQGWLQSQGQIGLESPRAVEWSMEARALPLHQLLKLRQSLPAGWRMAYTGDLRWVMKERQWKISSEGTMEGADVLARVTSNLNGSHTEQGLKRVTVQGQLRVARAAGEDRAEQTAVIKLDLAKGKGPIVANLQTEGLLAKATAQLDMPGEASNGEFMIAASSFTGLTEWIPVLVNAKGNVRADGTWSGPWKKPTIQLAANGDDLYVRGRFLKTVEIRASGIWGAQDGVRITAHLTDLQWTLGRDTGWDVTSLQFEAKNQGDHWVPSLEAGFRNQGSLTYSGLYSTTDETWKLTWEKLRLKPGHGPTLEAERPGHITSAANGSVRIEGLVIAGGKSRLTLERAVYRKPDIDVVVRSNDMDPTILTILLPDARFESGGYFRINGEVKGPFPHVLVNGEMIADIPRLKSESAGVEVRHIRAHIVSEEKSIRIERFTMETKKGQFEVTGKSTLPAMDFRMVGKNINVKRKKHYDAKGDLDIKLEGELDSPKITGTIRLEEGTYVVTKESRKAKAKRKQAAMERAKRPPSPVWENTMMKIDAQWPGHVWYRDGLSKIETNGDVRIQKDKGSTSVYLGGNIGIVRGSYDAYGRDFTLTSGDIAFTGPPEINPVLNIQAEYHSAGTIVYLEVKGTAKAPELMLRSNPPLPQQDIISVLVLGRPLNAVQTNPSAPTTSNNAQAGAIAGNVLSSMITSELRSSGLNIGLDVVRIEPTTQGNVLVVGRYIGTHIFVSYGQPLQATALRAYQANYYFAPNWTLIGESGTPDTAQANPTVIDNHIAVEFRHPLNK